MNLIIKVGQPKDSKNINNFQSSKDSQANVHMAVFLELQA